MADQFAVWKEKKAADKRGKQGSYKGGGKSDFWGGDGGRRGWFS